MEEQMYKIDRAPNPELGKGKNIEIVLACLRHGLRDPKDNSLTDTGRIETKQVAEKLGLRGQFDIIKPYGSTAGPYKEVVVESIKGKRNQEMGRSLETAMIFGENVLDVGQDMHNPSPVDTVNYKNLRNTPPYDHTVMYNSFLPESYNELSEDEKNEASRFAQKKTIEYLMSLNFSEAIKFKQEVAGGYALSLVHFSEMSKRLNSGQKILIPFGVHGGHMELLLQQAMVYKNKNNEKVIGFENLDTIGGEMDSSEGFMIRIKRDAQGELGEYVLTFFDQKNRPAGEFILDATKVKELADLYRGLHS